MQLTLQDKITRSKRRGMNVYDCALGLQIINLVGRRIGKQKEGFGIEEARIDSFVSDVYEKCKYYNLKPDDILGIEFLGLPIPLLHALFAFDFPFHWR